MEHVFTIWSRVDNRNHRKNKGLRPELGGTQMITYSEERALIDDIKEGIEIAMHREGYSPDQIDPIKVNKLAFLAIREFDLKITFGWFKYGPAPVDVAIRNGTGDASIEINPRPESKVPASDWSRVPSEELHHPSPEDYAEFYIGHEEFHRALETDTRSYLEHFYEQYAPAAYKDLYIACARLQRLLDQIDNPREWQSLDEEYYYDLSDALNDLYGELLQIPQIEESIDAFRQFKRLFKAVIGNEASQNRTIEQQRKFIAELVDFFYGNIWRYTALLISIDTVQGANADRLRNSIDSQLSEIRVHYESDIHELEERSRLLFDLDNGGDDTDLSEASRHVSNVEEWSQLTSGVLKE